MLHRDIKPDNILLSAKNRVVLIDFGSAREFTEGKTITQTAMLTPGFAPIEQYSNRAKRGTFTDIYALGATLYFLLTGHKPLAATDRYREQLAAPHQISPAVSEQLSSAVMMAMEMKEEDRFQHIGDFRAAMTILAKRKQINSTKVENEQKTLIVKKEEVSTPLVSNKNNELKIFVGIAAVTLIVFMLFSWFTSREKVEEVVVLEEVKREEEKVVLEESKSGLPAPKLPDTRESEIPNDEKKENQIQSSFNSSDDLLNGEYFVPGGDYLAIVKKNGSMITISFKPPYIGGEFVFYQQTYKENDNLSLTHYDDYENDNNLKVKILSKTSFIVHESGTKHWGADWPFTDRIYSKK
jgi:serine/threonine protein kinase